MKIIILSILLLLSGCTSYQDIQSLYTANYSTVVIYPVSIEFKFDLEGLYDSTFRVKNPIPYKFVFKGSHSDPPEIKEKEKLPFDVCRVPLTNQATTFYQLSTFGLRNRSPLVLQ
jgi:hypothetical protein